MSPYDKITMTESQEAEERRLAWVARGVVLAVALLVVAALAWTVTHG